jgi:hypothetical protein
VKTDGQKLVQTCSQNQIEETKVKPFNALNVTDTLTIGTGANGPIASRSICNPADIDGFVGDAHAITASSVRRP